MSTLSTCPHGRIWLRAIYQSCFSSSSRHASTTSAIHRGLRAEKDVSQLGNITQRAKQTSQRRSHAIQNQNNHGWATLNAKGKQVRGKGKREAFGDLRRNVQDGNIPKLQGQARSAGMAGLGPALRPSDRHNVRNAPSENGSARKARHSNSGSAEHVDSTAARARGRVNTGPMSIPRTTAASTYLYGFNSVIAALKAQRRKLYTLYTITHGLDYNTFHALKDNRPRGLVWKTGASRALLDAMSDGRPHNGVCLEASQLPAHPVLSLDLPDIATGDIPLRLERQSVEDAAINGTSSTLRGLGTSWRKPFVLMLDGILDPQNLGNIMRTAHFYGVDAIAVSINTCCPLTSATMAKASSGACEAVKILALPKPSDFVYASQKAGWKIYAAMPEVKNTIKTQISHVELSRSSPLIRDPVILVLGAEGDGLRENLKQKADCFVSISRFQGPPTQASIDVGVDSINVGTAAAVLVDSFLRKPLEGTLPSVGKGSGSTPVPGANRLF